MRGTNDLLLVRFLSEIALPITDGMARGRCSTMP